MGGGPSEDREIKGGILEMTTVGLFILAALMAVLVSWFIVSLARWLTDLYINWRF